MSILNAITSGAGGVALSGDTSGNLTIQSAGTNVANFNATTGFVSPVGLVTNGSVLTGALGANSVFIDNDGAANVRIRSYGPNTSAYANISFQQTYSNNSGTFESMRIDTSGNLLVGTSDAANSSGTGVKLAGNNSGPYVSVVSPSSSGSNFGIGLYSTGTSSFRFYVNCDGVVHSTSTTITAISDIRLKENVRDLDFGLNEIMSIQPRKFDWKQGKGLDKKDDVGFIAQEFETVFPNSVTDSMPDGDGIEYKSISQSELIPTMVKAIQELKSLVDAQAAEIAALKGA